MTANATNPPPMEMTVEEGSPPSVDDARRTRARVGWPDVVRLIARNVLPKSK